MYESACSGDTARKDVCCISLLVGQRGRLRAKPHARLRLRLRTRNCAQLRPRALPVAGSVTGRSTSKVMTYVSARS